jgi:hypothetical protein
MLIWKWIDRHLRWHGPLRLRRDEQRDYEEKMNCKFLARTLRVV